MSGKRRVQGLPDRSVRREQSEIGRRDFAGKVIPIVGSPCFGKHRVRAVIDDFSGLKFDFASVIEARYAAEGEHQRQVFRPGVGTLIVPDGLYFVRRIIVRIDVDDVVSGVFVITVVVLRDVESVPGFEKIPVHREIDDAGAAGEAVIRRMIGDAVEERVGRSRLPEVVELSV